MERHELVGKLVVFPDGIKVGRHDDIDIRWDDEKQAWYKFVRDEDGHFVENEDWWLNDLPRYARIFSTKIIDDPDYRPRKKTKFIPSKENCPVKIFPCRSTEKAYKVVDGDDGYGRSKTIYYKWIAKSVCYVDENGNVFAPAWAVR